MQKTLSVHNSAYVKYFWAFWLVEAKHAPFAIETMRLYAL